MSGVLPMKLSDITFNGRGIKTLSSTIFQGVTSPTLSCTFTNTSMVRLFSELFEDTGRAHNITIDIRNNVDLQYVENPSTGNRPGLHEKTFLIEFKIAGNELSCDCDVGYGYYLC